MIWFPCTLHIRNNKLNSGNELLEVVKLRTYKLTTFSGLEGKKHCRKNFESLVAESYW